MLRKDNTKAQAAIELAVFGAILIFVLGTIVRSAVGNGYSQNENFKAMRMALLASWNSSKAGSTARNSATVLFLEDRLSPDFNKYGDLDRNPFIAQGAGTLSYELLYPMDPGEVASMLPIMDVYINGQHFPFTTASYLTQTITRPASCPYAPNSCLQNQCLRNQREWVGGIVNASQFDNILPVGTLDSTTDATLTANGQAIFLELVHQGLVGTATGMDNVSSGFVTTAFSSMPSSFTITDPVTNQPLSLTQQEINGIQTILEGDKGQYKLFYRFVVNGTSEFLPTPPATCSGKDNALCSTLTTLDANGTSYTNTTGDMEYDLSRNGHYASVETQFPYVSSCSDIGLTPDMRCYIAWHWVATPGTDATSIGLDASSYQYPQYDIDGRLQPVTIYGISQGPDGSPTVTYEDYEGGDIDSTWNLASCGPRPGLLNSAQVYTFTKQGTYLQIKEGKLYNPETDDFVRSANKRDTIDLIQRTIQLSNNTGRFCSGSSVQSSVSGSSDPNPVEVCIAPGSSDNCFTSTNIVRTCYDQNDNRIFVRSRLEDRRGHFWFTDTSGQLKVQ